MATKPRNIGRSYPGADTTKEGQPLRHQILDPLDFAPAVESEEEPASGSISGSRYLSERRLEELKGFVKSSLRRKYLQLREDAGDAAFEFAVRHLVLKEDADALIVELGLSGEDEVLDILSSLH